MSKGITSLVEGAAHVPTVDELLVLFQTAHPELSVQHRKGDRACRRLAGLAEGAYGTLFDRLSPVGLSEIFPDWATHAEQGPFASLLGVYEALRTLPGNPRLTLS